LEVPVKALGSRLLLVALTFGIHACGGSSPSGPSGGAVTPPVPTPVPPPTFLDGWSDASVAAQATPPDPRIGQPISVQAPGFLIREQAYTGAAVHLWPGGEAYMNELVHRWEFTDGTFRMVRWSGPFTVTLDGDLATNDSVVAKTREVVSEMQRTSGLPITIGPGGAVVISLNRNILPDDSAVGVASLSFQGASIVGAVVVFANRGEITGGGRSDYRNTLLHEMGHVLGLGHSPNDRDVMTPGVGPGSKEARYQLNEVIALHMMYSHRSAGNFRPDRDSDLGARSTATPRDTVIRD
jgi:hypothetical protein